jgi:hypothetical protein
MQHTCSPRFNGHGSSTHNGGSTVAGRWCRRISEIRAVGCVQQWRSPKHQRRGCHRPRHWIAHATGAAVARDQHIAHDIAGLERPQELKNDVAKSQHIGKRDLFLLPFQ